MHATAATAIIEVRVRHRSRMAYSRRPYPRGANSVSVPPYKTGMESIPFNVLQHTRVASRCRALFLVSFGSIGEGSPSSSPPDPQSAGHIARLNVDVNHRCTQKQETKSITAKPPCHREASPWLQRRCMPPDAAARFMTRCVKNPDG